MKYSEEIIKVIEGAINRGVSIKKTCDLVGITQETFYQWMKDPEKTEFSDRIKKARSSKIANLLDHIRTAGIGKRDITCPKCDHAFSIELPTKQWQSLAWILERTEFNDFGVKQKIILPNLFW